MAALLNNMAQILIDMQSRVGSEAGKKPKPVVPLLTTPTTPKSPMGMMRPTLMSGAFSPNNRTVK